MTEIAKEYASALFELAQEDHTEAETLQALSAAEEQLREHPEYRELLASPGIPKKERLQLIGEAFASLPGRVCSFLKLLCGHGYIRELPHCTEEFAERYRKAQNIAVATVTAAAGLTDEEKERLRRALEKRSGHSVQLECRVDASLLGGVVVEMDGRVLDGSLRHRLHEIKEVMEQ